MRRPAPEGDALPPEQPGCDEFGGDVVLYADGELGEAERVALELHLDRCAACQRGVEFLLSFRRTLQRHAGATVPTSSALRARILSSLEDEPEEGTWALKLRRLMTPWPVAAAGATAVGVTAWLFFAPAPEDLVRDIVARHQRRLPMEIQSNDPQSLEKWLSDKVDFRVRIPRLANAPVHLLGARLSHVKDRSAVYLLYGAPDRPQARVSLLVFDDTSERPPLEGQPVRVQDAEVYTANRAGYNVAIWRRDEIVYSLVSDGDDDVMALVKAAASP